MMRLCRGLTSTRARSKEQEVMKIGLKKISKCLQRVRSELQIPLREIDQRSRSQDLSPEGIRLLRGNMMEPLALTSSVMRKTLNLALMTATLYQTKREKLQLTIKSLCKTASTCKRCKETQHPLNRRKLSVMV